jgi:hypothetical protein
MRYSCTFVAIVACAISCRFFILAADDTGPAVAEKPSGESSREVIKDKSPDGKFALRLTPGEKGWETAIIDAQTKKKIVDLESVAISGDKERVLWASSVDTFRIEDYAKDARLLWSNDSQRVAYFNEERGAYSSAENQRSRTTSVYFRNGDRFVEIPLPEFTRCDEIKDEDPKYLSTVWCQVTPRGWSDSGSLFVELSGEWRTLKGQMIGCQQNITLAFDAQNNVTAKVEKPREAIASGIESPRGNFYVEELEVPTKDDEGRPDTDLEVWIVSAKDPAMREPLPGFHEKAFTHLNSVSISPDENWMLVGQHHGSHMNSTYLFHRKEGVKFENVFPDASFDNEAWKFFCKVENVPKGKIDATDDFPEQVAYLDWSDDSARLLIDLHGGLTGKDTYYRLADYKKAGVSGWVAYFNTKTRKFELTDRLRKNNKSARKRWREIGNEEGEESGFVPSSAESIGHEGREASIAERLKKYESELAAITKRRESQLEDADRAGFEQKQKQWREELEDDLAKIKDPQKKLGARTRRTWYHIDEVCQEQLPVYEKSKTDETERSQP